MIPEENKIELAEEISSGYKHGLESKNDAFDIIDMVVDSEYTRDYHTKGMYSEKDLHDAFIAGLHFGNRTSDIDWYDFLEQNKKKP